MIRMTMKVKQGSFRRLEDPFENGKSTKYIFYVKVDDLPEGIPMATNPREQKLTTSVAEAIRDSLVSNDGYFHLKNRGIVISAESVHYSNARGEAAIVFSDRLLHGNIDGGHTYKIVCLHKGEGLDQYVQLEVMTGVEDIIEQLVEARNLSIDVDRKSLAELANRFEPIKEPLEGMPFFSRIAFKQNQTIKDPNTGKPLKMIDAREVVAIINMFHRERFGKNNHPTQAYSAKEKMLELYLEDPDHYRRFSNIIPDIFDLYDAVEVDFPEVYNDAGGRYGRKKYSRYKDGKNVGKSKFGNVDIRYKVPDGLIYPIVGAFRALVCYNTFTDKYEWINNLSPLRVWERCKRELVGKVMGFACAIGDNPNAVGKDSNIWDLAYMTVERVALEE